jgi:hypothetical protein
MAHPVLRGTYPIACVPSCKCAGSRNIAGAQTENLKLLTGTPVDTLTPQAVATNCEVAIATFVVTATSA